MECIIPARYIKLFAKSIQCMSKVGEEMYIEARDHLLILRTINSSRSAFLSFHLDERFFEAYRIDENTEKKYHVKLKPCQVVFRQYTNMEQCRLILDEMEQRLTFEILCKHGIQKVYKLAFEECAEIKAVYAKDDCRNNIISFPKKLIESINNFHTNLEEITVVANKDSMKIKSYIDDTKAASKALHTELTLDPRDFENYTIQNETSVTFCLKELKTCLTFCEASGQPVGIFFDQGGRPLCMSIKYFGVFESDFVFATLLDPSSQGSQSGSVPSSSPTSSSDSVSFQKRKKPSNSLSSPPSSVSSSPSIQSWSQNKLSPSSGRSDHRIPSSSPLGAPSPLSSDNVITSGSSSQLRRPQMDAEETMADGDYESEVEGTPPLKKLRSSPPPSEEPSNDDTMDADDDDEEVPCSIEDDN